MAEQIPPPRPIDAIDQRNFCSIAADYRSPQNRDTLFAKLPKSLARKLDSTDPMYDRGYDVPQAVLDALLGEDHLLLQGNRRQRLANEMVQAFRAMGIDLTERSTPFEELVRVYLGQFHSVWTEPLKTPEEIKRKQEETSTLRPPGQSLGQKLGGIFRRSSPPATPDQSMLTQPSEGVLPEAPTAPQTVKPVSPIAADEGAERKVAETAARQPLTLEELTEAALLNAKLHRGEDLTTLEAGRFKELEDRHFAAYATSKTPPPAEAPTPPPAPAGAQPEEATKLQLPQETQETITPQQEETVKNLLPPLRQAIADNNQDQKQALEAQIAEAFHLSPDQRYLTDEERSALLETHPDIFGVTTLVDSVYQASLTQRFFFQAPVELQEALARYQEANRLSTPLEKHSSSKEAYEKFRDALERAAGIDREADRARRWEYDLKLASAEGELKQVLFNPTFSAEELKELLIKRNLARHEIVQVDLEQGERLHRFLDGLAEKAGLTIKMARFGAFQLVEKTPPQLGGP